MSEKIEQDNDDPSPRPAMVLSAVKGGDHRPHDISLTATRAREEQSGIFDWVRGMVAKKPDSALREALEDFIEESSNGEAGSHASTHESTLITNVIQLRDLTVVDVMIPRVDIVAIDITTSQQDLLELLTEKQFSRLPVFRDSLDDIVGTIHIKDILATLARNEKVQIKDLVRDVPIVSPSLPVLDLILMMKQMRKHMALVVDEYGGIDGLVTIGDVIEMIMGAIEDEHNGDSQPEIIKYNDGSLMVDARYDIDEFEKNHVRFLSEDEREDIDTLGGLLFALSGRIPARGELITHPSGIVFEVIDADPRRVNKVLIKNIPLSSSDN